MSKPRSSPGSVQPIQTRARSDRRMKTRSVPRAVMNRTKAKSRRILRTSCAEQDRAIQRSSTTKGLHQPLAKREHWTPLRNSSPPHSSNRSSHKLVKHATHRRHGDRHKARNSSVPCLITGSRTTSHAPRTSRSRSGLLSKSSRTHRLIARQTSSTPLWTSSDDQHTSTIYREPN